MTVAEHEEATQRSGGLTHRAARGAMITTGGQLVRLATQLGGTAILARLLSPTDYGLVAMAMIVVGIGEIFREFGLSAAAVQSKELTVGQRANLFWANTALGTLLFALTFALAAPIAALFDQPDLVGLTRVLGLMFILNGLTAQFRASLNRDLRFAGMTGADLSSQVLGLAAGVAAALLGWGYWSLAVMQLVQAGLAAVFLMAIAKWWPGLPRRGEDMGHFLRFGANLVGSQLVSYAGTRADSFILGYQLGPASLGLYDRAYRLVMVPLGQLRAPLTSVALPVMSRVQDDQDRYEVAMLRGQIAMGYTLVPVMALLAGLSTPVVLFMMGPKWSDTAPLFGLLAIATVLQLLAYIGYWVYLSRALTRQLFYFTFVSAGVRITAILIGAQWGVLGVAFGVVAASAMLWPLSLWWLSRCTMIPVRAIYNGAFRILMMAAAAAIAAYLAATWSPIDNVIAQLVLGGAAGVAVYGAGFLVPPIRRDLQSVIGLIRVGRKH